MMPKVIKWSQNHKIIVKGLLFVMATVTVFLLGSLLAKYSENLLHPQPSLTVGQGPQKHSPSDDPQQQTLSLVKAKSTQQYTDKHGDPVSTATATICSKNDKAKLTNTYQAAIKQESSRYQIDLSKIKLPILGNTSMYQKALKLAEQTHAGKLLTLKKDYLSQLASINCQA